LSKVVLAFSASLDGFVADPGINIENAMGLGGERLHQWMFQGDRENDIDSGMVREHLAMIGAVVLGKRTFDVGLQHWDDTPYPVPSFVLTHEKREPQSMKSAAFTFVNEGIAIAIAKAKAAANRKAIVVMGAYTAQQALKEGLADELHVQLVPVLLGKGTRLFENFGEGLIELTCDRAVNSPNVTHLKYKVVKPSGGD
jgi:dihydrofolate reductase